MEKQKKILFLQEFSLKQKGGGVAILKRLMAYAPYFNYLTKSAFDRANQKKQPAESGEIDFRTLPRNFRFGIGRLFGWLTIKGYDVLAIITLKRLFKKEEPDIIHLTAHSVCFPATMRAARKTGKSIVVSVHDLWPLSVKGYVSWVDAEAIFKEMTKDIDTIYVISEEMKEYLIKSIGKKNYQVIHDGVNDITLPVKMPNEKKSISLFYAGTLHGMQLKLFISLLDVLSGFIEWDIKIGICSNTYFSVQQDYSNVSIENHGWVNEEQLKILSANYRFGILPLSFEPDDEIFYHTSLMTKIPLYVGLGLPIICIGPINSSAIQLIKKEGIGFVITSNVPEEIKKNLFKVFQNPDIMGSYAEQIKKSALTTFNINTIAERFYRHLPA